MRGVGFMRRDERFILYDYLLCWEELMFFLGCLSAVGVAFWRLVGFV